MAATRHSGLECLRIISIILIVSMHILGNTFHTSNWLNKEFNTIYQYTGKHRSNLVHSDLRLFWNPFQYT